MRTFVPPITLFAFAGLLLFAEPPLAQPAPSIAPIQRLSLEPNRKATFGPQKVTPAGTVFFIKVLKKADNNVLRLHRCNVPCNSAVSVKVWDANEYTAGDELNWRVPQEGKYYLWNQDPRNNTPMIAISSELTGDRLRITYDSGAVLEAWYVVP